MSRLKELIQELCPEGVEIKELSEVIISLNTGLNPRKFFQLNTDDALNYYVTIREMHGGKIVFTEKTDRINNEALKLCNNRSNLECGDVLFSGTGTIGETVVIDETPYNWNIKEGVYTIKPNPAFIESKFLSHLLRTSEVRNRYMKKVSGGTVKSISMAELKKVKIPVPHLEVQHKIVHILDSFTLLTAELTARKKQYEFYKNKMLTFDTKITRKKLGEIFDFRNGLSKGKEFFGSGTPFIRYTDVYNHRSLKKEDITALVECTSSELEKLRVSRGDVLFTRTSETAEDVGWAADSQLKQHQKQMIFFQNIVHTVLQQIVLEIM